MQYSNKYVFLFTAGVCVICSLMISVAAVALRERQELNQKLNQQRSVLQAAGLMETGESLGVEEVQERFATIKPVLIDLETGEPVDKQDPMEFDKEAVPTEPAPKNSAQIQELPEYVRVYYEMDGDEIITIILPIEGKGLWSTLYGFIALEADTTTVRGLTYYQHGETPGLGGEVDNPKWKAKWAGRHVYDNKWEPAIEVIKGQAGPPDEAPHQVDGLSGATLTSRGVTNMLQFWLGENGYGPFLEHFREEHGVAGTPSGSA